MKAGDVAAAQLWDLLATLLDEPNSATLSDELSVIASDHEVPLTPAGRFEVIPSPSPEERGLSLSVPPLDPERRSRPLKRTPSGSMLAAFMFGSDRKALLDRVAPQTPTGSPKSTSPSHLHMTGGRLSPVTPMNGSRRPHQRTVSAAAVEMSTPRRSQSPTPRTASSRSLSRLGRRVSRPKPFLSETASRTNKNVEASASNQGSDNHTDSFSRASSAEALGQNGMLTLTSSVTSQMDIASPHRSAPSTASSQRSIRSSTSRHASKSSGGRSRDRGSSWSATGSSGGRSRSHSITSTTAYLALQDDISESSEGDLGDRSVELDEQMNTVIISRPPSPISSTVAPIAPSPLSQTVVASSSLESQAGQFMGEVLTRVDEVAEPSSFRSAITITAPASMTLGVSVLSTSISSQASQSTHDFNFQLSEESFASDDAMDADDNYDPSSSAEDDNTENSPRPGRFQIGFPRGSGIPDFGADSEGETDVDEANEDPDPYLARHFSETSIQTAVPLSRSGANGAEPIYSAFRIQRASNGGGTSRSRSRRGSLISRVSTRSRSQPHSRSTSRPRMSSRGGSYNSRVSSEVPGDNVKAGDEVADTSITINPPVAEQMRGRQNQGRSGEGSRGRQERRRLPAIVQAQERFREIGWAAFRHRVEEEIEAGNLQLASLLVLVGGEDVLEDAHRSESLVESYIGNRQFIVSVVNLA